tara:strand:- start:869 stop:1069 length:201 start_codon:yes stop_codon:yes gene_type:complete
VNVSQRIKIDDLEVYEEDLTNAGKALLEKIRATDTKLTELQDDRSILQTAKNAYEGMVREALLQLK